MTLMLAGVASAQSGGTPGVVRADSINIENHEPYPWRLSYFPYVTASPNDGVMAMGRVVLFRPSRWDDRVSIHDQIALEGGYSTKDAWLVRARGDFPRIGDGWRLQGFAEAARLPGYFPGNSQQAVTRQIAGAEVTRRLHRSWYLALRGEAMHVAFRVTPIVPTLAVEPATETDVRGRMALVYDRRDREYDTRRGLLVQGGVLGGSAGTGYAGFYAIASVWIPFGEKTRATVRSGFRDIDEAVVDAIRIVPGWEDEFVAGGGPESNRALPIGEHAVRHARFSSVEVRHDVKVFPGGAIAVLGFVDATSTVDDPSASLFEGLTVGLGGGIALRLLRNAVLTATVARAEHATRVYVGSGWSW